MPPKAKHRFVTPSNAIQYPVMNSVLLSYYNSSAMLDSLQVAKNSWFGLVESAESGLALPMTIVEANGGAGFGGRGEEEQQLCHGVFRNNNVCSSQANDSVPIEKRMATATVCEVKGLKHLFKVLHTASKIYANS